LHINSEDARKKLILEKRLNISKSQGNCCRGVAGKKDWTGKKMAKGPCDPFADAVSTYRNNTNASNQNQQPRKPSQVLEHFLMLFQPLALWLIISQLSNAFSTFPSFCTLSHVLAHFLYFM